MSLKLEGQSLALAIGRDIDVTMTSQERREVAGPHIINKGGNGTVFGINLLGSSFQPMLLMILPAGAITIVLAWLIFKKHGTIETKKMREMEALKAEEAASEAEEKE